MNATTTTKEREYLDVEEAADLLNVKLRFIRRLIAEARMPVYRFGRHVRLRRVDLMEYIAAARREAARQARWPRPVPWR